MKPIRTCLGENVKRLRNQRQLTQGELAEACDLSLSFLQNIEAGKKWASAETIACLAKHFKVRESELFIEHDRVKHDPHSVIAYLCEALGVERS